MLPTYRTYLSIWLANSPHRLNYCIIIIVTPPRLELLHHTGQYLIITLTTPQHHHNTPIHNISPHEITHTQSHVYNFSARPNLIQITPHQKTHTHVHTPRHHNIASSQIQSSLCVCGIQALQSKPLQGAKINANHMTVFQRHTYGATYKFTKCSLPYLHDTYS